MKVIIVGAGIMGLSIGWRLAAAGAAVDIVDSRAPGHGATLAALGALWPPGPLVKGPLQALHRRSLGQFEAFATAISRAAGMATGFRRLGRIEILNSAKAAKHALLEVAAEPATLRLIDCRSARETNPGLAPFDHGALHCTLTAQVNVHELVAALVQACRSAGIIFHELIGVTGLVYGRGVVAGVETAAGLVGGEGDIFLITAGAWTGLFSPPVSQIAPITPAKGQGIAVAMPANRPLTAIIKSGPTYLIPWENEILIGATTEPEAGFDETPTDSACRQLLAAAGKIIPELQGVPVRRHWAGLRPFHERKPHLPVMGRHPAFGNLYVCSGHYKTGIGLSPLVSELMAQAILEGREPEALCPFLPVAPSLTDTPFP